MRLRERNSWLHHVLDDTGSREGTLNWNGAKQTIIRSVNHQPRESNRLTTEARKPKLSKNLV